MIIKQYKSFVYTLFLCSTLVLCGCALYALGRIHGLALQQKPLVLTLSENAYRERIATHYDASLRTAQEGSAANQESITKDCAVLASINGSKYYFPTCSGISRIAPENLRCFPSEEAAREAQYTLAKTCS